MRDLQQNTFKLKLTPYYIMIYIKRISVIVNDFNRIVSNFFELEPILN